MPSSEVGWTSNDNNRDKNGIKRQRRTFHHKTALSPLRQYDTIYLEDVQVRNLVRNPHLATRISDAGWAVFRTILESKAADAGTWVIAAPPAYTSQNCSGVLGVLPAGSRCLQRVAKSLSVRTHICPSCGLVLDRDENAARTILRAGQARQGAVALAAVVNGAAHGFRRGEHVTESLQA